MKKVKEKKKVKSNSKSAVEVTEVVEKRKEGMRDV